MHLINSLSNSGRKGGERAKKNIIVLELKAPRGDEYMEESGRVKECQKQGWRARYFSGCFVGQLLCQAYTGLGITGEKKDYRESVKMADDKEWIFVGSCQGRSCGLINPGCVAWLRVYHGCIRRASSLKSLPNQTCISSTISFSYWIGWSLG